MTSFMYGEAVHDACVQLGREMGSVGPPDPAFDRAFDQMQEARQMAQEKVRTSIPNPFAVVHDLQAAAKKYPDLQGLCDRTITLVLVCTDKMAAARAALNDVVVK